MPSALAFPRKMAASRISLALLSPEIVTNESTADVGCGGSYGRVDICRLLADVDGVRATWQRGVVRDSRGSGSHGSRMITNAHFSVYT